jgi:hypothetical protein
LLAADLTPNGYSPAQIRHAYGFDKISAQGAGQTIAIIDAFDDPTIGNDLAVFKSAFGISGCSLTKVDQNGGTTFPAVDPGWALEIAIDVEWVCAIAPGASILLVEAKDNTPDSFFAAVDYAAKHAQVVATSISGNEFPTEGSFDGHFNVPGVTFLAASGDNAAAVQWPASSPYVIGVGGTSLPLDGAGNLTGPETAWSGGGGISAYEPEPDYQASLPIPSTGGKRGVPDVSFDADPKTGVAVYISTPFQGQTGWVVAGGTSLSVMIAAGWVALTGNTLASIYASAKANYVGNFRDIISGSSAHQGYDFVTGLGSPLASSSDSSTPTQSPAPQPAPPSSGGGGAGPSLMGLAVLLSGSGQGVVNSMPEGINCGSICSATFTSGTRVTLTATAAGGSIFGGWSGCDSTSGNQCTVNISGNRTVNAIFTVQAAPQPAPPPAGGGSSPSLMGLAVLVSGSGQGTVNSVPDGISCGSVCSATFADGMAVTLTATPADGSTFDGWNGCDSTSEDQCSVSINANRMVNAAFTLQATPQPVPSSGGEAGGGFSLALHAGWNMISSPLAVVSLSALSGDCSFTDGPWWWDGFQYELVSTIEPAKGSWVKTASPCTMQASGNVEAENLTLVDGWNMISSSGSWNQMNTGGCTLLAGPFWYDGAQYQSLGPDSAMNGFLGYWVKVGGSCGVSSQGLRPHSLWDESLWPPGPPTN